MIKADSEYALSLFTLAKEQKRVDDYAACLRTVQTAIEANPDWILLLHNPAIPVKERLELIDEAFASLEVKEVLYFVKLLCEKGRVRLLSECISEFFSLENAWRQRIIVKVCSAIPLTDEQKEKLEEKIKKRTGKIPETLYSVDSSLIGGVRVQIEDAVLDGSLSARLDSLKGVIEK